MKHALLVASLALATSHAAIVVPGANGTDDALNITANTEIDLSLAPTAAWDSDNTANAGKGVYDAAKWAVVFKYTSVNVAAGATVTFKNHPSRAPVVWLVSGNVLIAGTVKLDGQDGYNLSLPGQAEPGPGGYRGGTSWFSSSTTQGAGFGPGGSQRGYDRAASYGTVGTSGPAAYGNPSLIPLVGGSGGGGSGDVNNRAGGGGGGGALLLASSGSVTINGAITAKGGANRFGTQVGLYSTSVYSSPGSGGGIRIVADQLLGTGLLNASGGQDIGSRVTPAVGRVRLERVVNTNTIQPTPAPSVVDLAVDTTAVLWPPAGSPEVKIISIGGTNSPAEPRAGLGTNGADVTIPSTTTAAAVIETTNVEQASQVKVRITPRDSADYAEIQATYSSTVSTSPLVIRWSAALPTNLGYSAVQVRVVRP